MNTMLPMFYNFRSENVLTPNRVNLNLIDKMPKWIGIIAIIVVVIMAIVIFIEGGQHIDSLEKSVEFLLLLWQLLWALAYIKKQIILLL